MKAAKLLNMYWIHPRMSFQQVYPWNVTWTQRRLPSRERSHDHISQLALLSRWFSGFPFRWDLRSLPSLIPLPEEIVEDMGILWGSRLPYGGSHVLGSPWNHLLIQGVSRWFSIVRPKRLCSRCHEGRRGHRWHRDAMLGIFYSPQYVLLGHRDFEDF